MPDALSLIAHIHGLAAADRRARARVSRLLCIGEIEAAVVLGLAGGRAVTLDTLAAELDLSEGGARALAATLQHEALVRAEPVPARPREIALRLAPGAALELAAALAPLTDRLDAIPDMHRVASCLAAVADACGGLSCRDLPEKAT
jgi:hypothetical protein